MLNATLQARLELLKVRVDFVQKEIGVSHSMSELLEKLREKHQRHDVYPEMAGTLSAYLDLLMQAARTVLEASGMDIPEKLNLACMSQNQLAA